MARILVPAEARRADRFLVEGEPFHHAVRVLRLGDGDRLQVVDGSGIEYECVVVELSARSLVARIVRARRLPGEARLQLRLYCALLKGDKADLVIQKATEIGVERIVFYRADRSTARIAPPDEEARRARWRRIVAAAVAQSGRPRAPGIEGPLSFAEALDSAREADLALLPWEGDGVQSLPRLSDVVTGAGRIASASVVIGPEGGFSGPEVEQAKARGVIAVTLGPRILRAETAAVVVPALVLAACGDLG
jgi:16S rRNA (uracil1498-N3)-methyltransferase